MTEKKVPRTLLGEAVPAGTHVSPEAYLSRTNVDLNDHPSGVIEPTELEVSETALRMACEALQEEREAHVETRTERDRWKGRAMELERRLAAIRKIVR